MTGLLIRDFFKEYRELRYSNSGSIEITDIEHNAYRLSLTLEITHIDAFRYGSLKTIPSNTHYGYATTFRGSTVLDTVQVKYPKFRVFDIINSGVWQYHQATEALQLNDTGLAVALDEYLTTILPEVAADYLPSWLLRNLINDTSTGSQGLEWVSTMLQVAADLGEAIPDEENTYRAFPVATPFPDIVKFKSDVPCSFLFRLESWYLVNPAVYISDNPTDTSDETDGESEYPEPDNTDGFPPNSPRDPGRDSRDYTGGGELIVPDGGTVTVRVKHKAYAYGCAKVDYITDHTIGYFGSSAYTTSYIGSVNGCDGAQTAGGIKLNIPNAASIIVAPLEEQQYAPAEIVDVIVNQP